MVTCTYFSCESLLKLYWCHVYSQLSATMYVAATSITLPQQSFLIRAWTLKQTGSYNLRSQGSWEPSKWGTVHPVNYPGIPNSRRSCSDWPVISTLSGPPWSASSNSAWSYSWDPSSSRSLSSVVCCACRCGTQRSRSLRLSVGHSRRFP